MTATDQNSRSNGALQHKPAGPFFYAVRTTGVFCRPTCGARPPLPQNVEYFETTAAAAAAGYRPCLRCHPLEIATAEARHLGRLCRFIESHSSETLNLDQLGAFAGQSASHLQRSFKAALGISPREYMQACRLRTLKRHLRQGHSVTRAMVDAGYGSTSRLYETSNAALGMTPSRYRNGAPGVAIRYATVKTPLGWLILAATEVGVCSIQLADSRAALLDLLREEFPAAKLTDDQAGLEPWLTAVASHIAGSQPMLDLPLDIRATAFQHRVWNYLRTIPYGTTQTYGEIAEALGAPSASRAVAGACAANRIALAIPCHRIVRKDGESGGYRWGAERKKKILESERKLN